MRPRDRQRTTSLLLTAAAFERPPARAGYRLRAGYLARCCLLTLAVAALATIGVGRAAAEEDLKDDLPTTVRQFKIKVHVIEKSKQGEPQTVACPQVITTDDVPASISIGNQVPVPGTHQLETVPTGVIARFRVKWLADERIRLDVAFESRKAIKADLDDLMIAARSIRAVTEAKLGKINRYVVSKSDAGDPDLWLDVQVDCLQIEMADADSAKHAAADSKRARPANLETRVYAVPDLVRVESTSGTSKPSPRHIASLVSFSEVTSFKELTATIYQDVRRILGTGGRLWSPGSLRSHNQPGCSADSGGPSAIGEVPGRTSSAVVGRRSTLSE